MTYNRYRGFPKSSVNFGNRQFNFLTKLLFSSVKTIVKGSSSNSKSVGSKSKRTNISTDSKMNSVKTIVNGSSSNSKSVGSKSKRTNIPTYNKLNVWLVPVEVVEDIMQKYNLLIDKSIAQLDKNHKLYNIYRDSKGLQIKEFKQSKTLSREYKPIKKLDLQIQICYSISLIYNNIVKMYSTSIPNKELYYNDMSFWDLENIKSIIESYRAIDDEILKKY